MNYYAQINETQANGDQYIRTLSKHEILELLLKDKRIIFIDTREPEEFLEAHIPGAMNIQLRAFDVLSGISMSDADLFIPYCMKDFRGFEVAKRLKQQGVDNVFLMKPYGFNDWKVRGFPVAGILSGKTDSQGLSDLHRYVNEYFVAASDKMN